MLGIAHSSHGRSRPTHTHQPAARSSPRLREGSASSQGGDIGPRSALPLPLDDDPLGVRVVDAEQLSHEQYHAEPLHVSSTQLKVVLRSPAHFLLARNLPREPSTSMLFGIAVHCALLEPERFAATYVEDPGFDRRTKAGKASAAAFDAEHPGKLKLSAEECAAIARIRVGVFQHATARALFELADRVTEESIFWRDPITQVRQKARPDLRIGHGAGLVLIDLKTTRDAREYAFAWQARELDYHLSAAMYSEGVRIAYGERPLFAWLAIEASGVVALYQPKPEFFARGERRYRRALATLATCIETNQWPGYQDGRSIEPLGAPKRARVDD